MSKDFDALDELWGDDLPERPKKPKGEKPDPKDEGKEKPAGPETQNASMRLYGGVDFLPMPDARDRPAADPLQWGAFQAQWGTRPYTTPLEEFCQNSHKLNMATLLHRWQGLGKEKEIMDIFTNPDSLAERARAQSIRKRKLCLPDPNDREDMAIENAYQLQIAKDRIDFLKFCLDQNAAPTTENYFLFKEGGTHIEEKYRTLSPAARTRLDNDLMKWIEMYRVLTAQPTKITEKKHDHSHTITGSVNDLFTSKLLSINHTTKQGFAFADLVENKPLELPAAPGDVVEGEIVPNEIVYKRPFNADPEKDGAS